MIFDKFVILAGRKIYSLTSMDIYKFVHLVVLDLNARIHCNLLPKIVLWHNP